MSIQEDRVLQLVEVPAGDGGREVLWAEALGGMYRLLSVPVFAYDLSRGSLVSAGSGAARLQLDRVLEPSDGATIRCYVATGHGASQVHAYRIAPDSDKLGLPVGPATLFDPDVVALHVTHRDQVRMVGTYLDGLVREGVLRFWELSDPAPTPAEEEAADGTAEQWELVHPLPVDGKPSTVHM